MCRIVNQYIHTGDYCREWYVEVSSVVTPLVKVKKVVGGEKMVRSTKYLGILSTWVDMQRISYMKNDREHPSPSYMHAHWSIPKKETQVMVGRIRVLQLQDRKVKNQAAATCSHACFFSFFDQAQQGQEKNISSYIPCPTHQNLLPASSLASTFYLITAQNSTLTLSLLSYLSRSFFFLGCRTNKTTPWPGGGISDRNSICILYFPPDEVYE